MRAITIKLRPNYFDYNSIPVCCGHALSAPNKDVPKPQKEYLYAAEEMDMPSVKAEIKKVVTKELKDGTLRKAWGVVLTVDKKKYPLYFGNKAQSMILICTLLRKKMGEPLYLHEFYNNSQGRLSAFQRMSSRKWIEKVFEELYRGDFRCFEDWTRKNEDPKYLGRPLHQAKSRLNSTLKEILKDQPDALRMCTIESVNKKHDTYYDINIRPQDIIVPSRLQYLITDFDKLMGIDR